MKSKIFTIIITVIFAFSLTSIAQDNSSTNYDQQKLNTPYVPEKSPRGPVGPQNDIRNLTNCPSTESGGLKIPLDTLTFTKAAFTNGVPPDYRNDDGSTLAIPIPFTFTLYGDAYTSVYINNNGNLTFTGPSGIFTPTGFPGPVARVAPFWSDVDTRPLASGIVWYKIESNRMTVIWDKVGYYNLHTDLLDEFECIISDGTDPLVGLGNNVCFSYNLMQFTTGDASGGIGGFFGAPATVGVNKGNSINYTTLGRFSRPGNYYGGNTVDTNGVGFLDKLQLCFDVSTANPCPIATGFASANICQTTFLNQGTFTDVQDGLASWGYQVYQNGLPIPTPCFFSIVTNPLIPPSNTVTFIIEIKPEFCNLGLFTVCYFATDLGTPPCTEEVCVIYDIQCPQPVELSSFTSIIHNRDVNLNWTTATESNNARFEIERAVNSNWQKIGEVAGSGTTTTPNNYSYLDRGLISGTYNYRLKQIDINGNFEYFNLSGEVIIGAPDKFELNQNYPNPFNPTTRIDYSIPSNGNVSLSIFDATGKEVSRLVNGNQTAGYYSVDFNASNLASGIYYYRIEVTGNTKFAETKKMLLLK